MSFPQKQVGMSYCKGVAGDKATLNPVTYFNRNPLVAADESVFAGSFCFLDADGFATKTGDADSLCGFVQRNLSYSGYDIGASLEIHEGFGLNVAIRGDFYAMSATVAAIGDAVFASTTDGSISTAAAGSAPAGTIDTGWYVSDIEDGTVGSLIVISNW